MNFTARVLFLFIVVTAHSAFAQDVFSPYYVVIGGFQNEENAREYCTYAHEQNLPAVYAFNPERKIFYVYVRATQARDVAYEILNNLRKNSVFKDSWVFNGVLSGADLLPKNQAQVVQEISRVEPEPLAEPVEEAPEDRSSASVPEKVQETPVEAPQPPAGKPFLFKLVNKSNGNPVNGLIRLQESDKATQFRGFNSNEKVYVPAPANRSGKWFVVSHVLGYRPFKLPVVYDKADQSEGAVIGTGQEIIISMELDRVRRGDYIEMEGVKFYNNTALFTPGSERELDELVAMMQENPNYQIRLHGHTNGDQARDIVSLGESSDFFRPNTANAKTQASSRELSLLRAELVKAYLVSKGIDEARITTKGEGGKQMIFDPRGTLAGMNDRVEVEIRKN